MLSKKDMTRYDLASLSKFHTETERYGAVDF